MDDGAELRVDCFYDVPFVWYDRQQERERFGSWREVMPVGIRHVDPASVEDELRRSEGVGASFRVSVIEGDTWIGLYGVPIQKLTAPGAQPMDVWTISGGLPPQLLPTREQMRRKGADMRGQAVAYPVEMAAARVQRVLAADYVQDGRWIYRRKDSRDPKAAFFQEGVTTFKMRVKEVLEAGDRTMRARLWNRGLEERLGDLRRTTLRLYLEDLGPEDMPAANRQLAEAAEAVSIGHPTERIRKRMARIARDVDAPPVAGPDDDYLAGLAP